MGSIPENTTAEHVANRLKQSVNSIERGVMRAEQAYLAVCFLRQANKERHGNLMVFLENSYTMGDNKYPTTVTEAYNMLLRYRNHHYSRGGGGSGGVEGVSLNTVEQHQGSDEGGRDRPKGRNTRKKCYVCGKFGHISYDCPEEKAGDEKSEKHNTNATVEKEGQDEGPPSQVNVDSRGGDDDKSIASTLPGSIQPGKKYDPITGRVLTTIFQEVAGSDEDSWEEFTFVAGTGGLPEIVTR
mmetsp:Transcript_5248/g.10758  ORF Transcript_5248/g.10758 Transcript_5248/m.10758 type:complete len:241 (+) Transcript_5248:650-1372(+)